MKTMNMPGFTAEASLYAVRTKYRMASAGFFAANGNIQPQLRRTPGDCIPGCICVSPIDCPCCDSWPWPWPQDGNVFRV